METESQSQEGSFRPEGCSPIAHTTMELRATQHPAGLPAEDGAVLHTPRSVQREELAETAPRIASAVPSSVHGRLVDQQELQSRSLQSASTRRIGQMLPTLQTEGPKQESMYIRSPPRAPTLLDSPFRRPPALLGPFGTGIQSPEVISPLYWLAHRQAFASSI